MGHPFPPDRGNTRENPEQPLLDGFRLYLQAAGIRSSLRYLHSVRHFLGFCEEAGIRLQAVRLSDADAYRRRLLEEGKARATVNNELNRIRRFSRWAWKRRFTAEDPFARLRGLPTGRSLPKAILCRFPA